MIMPVVRLPRCSRDPSFTFFRRRGVGRGLPSSFALRVDFDIHCYIETTKVIQGVLCPCRGLPVTLSIYNIVVDAQGASSRLS